MPCYQGLRNYSNHSITVEIQHCSHLRHGRSALNSYASQFVCSCIHHSATEWMDTFFEHCTGCRVDFMTLHIYTCDVATIKIEVDKMAARYNRPVWVTEFMCPNTGRPLEREVNFMDSAMQVSYVTSGNRNSQELKSSVAESNLFVSAI